MTGKSWHGLSSSTVLFVILQEQHEDQIKEIRKAGHDTLAVIVEEYKVLLLKL